MMKKEIEDGVTAWSDLFTDTEGWTWNILQREGGSLSLYATQRGGGYHAVVYDTLDSTQPNPTAQMIIGRLREMVEGVNLLLAAVDEAKEPARLAALSVKDEEQSNG